MKPQVILATIATSLLAGGYAGAYPLHVDEEKGIAVNVGVLLQPWFQVTAPSSANGGSPGIGAPDGKSPSFDFFLRRARLMVWGSATKELSYFIETDQPNWGKGGNFTITAPMFIQDAFLSYAFAPEFKVDFGLMLLPFSHHTIEGATGLNSLDYHADTIRFPAAFVFRDIGVQFRGLLLDDLIYYRAGIFEGVRNSALPAAPATLMPPRPLLNETGLPRITGQVRLNLMGAEPDFFFKGIYFSAKPLVSIGVGVDYQPNAVYKLDGQPGSYFALSTDVFAEYPLTPDDEIIAQGNLFVYPEGTTSFGGVGGIPGTAPLTRGGIAFFAQAGFRHEFIEPKVFIDYLKAKEDSLTIIAPHVGCNFWVNKHAFNVKVDIGYRKQDTPGAAGATNTTKDILGTVQTQVFF